jgi:hypothetical protein
MIREHAPSLLESESSTGSALFGCLGRTFSDDEARCSCFVHRPRENLLDSAFRQIDGFPMGAFEGILTVSDPPYFAACPNPLREKGLVQ